MPEKAKNRTQIPVLLLTIATILVGALMIYLYTRSPKAEEATSSVNLPTVIPLEANDPAGLEQNGQPLTNNGSPSSSQSFQNTSPIDQSPESSNLQGSPSTQQAAPAESIPSDWLE